ncbi:hypothetical protein KC19_VG058200 [Ceratodon purpureus]|uniref:Uncharacterized protein n=1 Tax=Ceratodon purpureus TaxID=3225 RepID=A0A8T0HMD1_CERPU|nr:hypothetical protein KC19_VG058200 [Ceratodon purpureus]
MVEEYMWISAKVFHTYGIDTRRLAKMAEMVIVSFSTRSKFYTIFMTEVIAVNTGLEIRASLRLAAGSRLGVLRVLFSSMQELMSGSITAEMVTICQC